MIFEIVSTYFIVYETYFVVCGLCRDIRTAGVSFVVYDLFWLFVISDRT